MTDTSISSPTLCIFQGYMSLASPHSPSTSSMTRSFQHGSVAIFLIHSLYSTHIKHQNTLLLGRPPLGEGVQRRPIEPLSCHLVPQLSILDKLLHWTHDQRETWCFVHACLMRVPKLKILSVRTKDINEWAWKHYLLQTDFEFAIMLQVRQMEREPTTIGTHLMVCQEERMDTGFVWPLVMFSLSSISWISPSKISPFLIWRYPSFDQSIVNNLQRFYNCLAPKIHPCTSAQTFSCLPWITGASLSQWPATIPLLLTHIFHELHWCNW